MVVQNIEPARNLMTLTNVIGNFRGRELNKEPQARNGNSGTMLFQSPTDMNGGENSDTGEPPRNVAKAVLICRPNSHPFQERTLSLNQGVKIGRSVAKARPSPNNAIFDCKVLSRNHALMWYENGKFYLQDVKSSNGTFVNNQRLSKGSEESAPREICSGDIVQFGVDVVENTRRVTHGCIIATVKLFLPDGKEAKASSSTAVVSSFTGSVSLQDMQQLHHCIQEAMRREEQLKEKINGLHILLTSTNSASQKSWKSLIDEDRLLTRVEILESQLQVYSKNLSEDKLRDELRRCQTDKEAYQNTAKETLCHALHEKTELHVKLKDSERMAITQAEDIKYYKELVDRRDKEMEVLSEQYEKEIQARESLHARLRELEVQAKALETLEEQSETAESSKSEVNGMSDRDETSQAVDETTTEDSSEESEAASSIFLPSGLPPISRSVSCDSIVTIVDDEKPADKPLVNGFSLKSVGVQVDQMLESIADTMETDLRSALRQNDEEIAFLKEKLRSHSLEASEVVAQKCKIEHLYNACFAESVDRMKKLQTFAEENERLTDRIAEREAEIKSYQEKLMAVESSSDQVKSLNDETATVENLRKRTVVLEQTIASKSCSVQLLKELLAESREAKTALEEQYRELKTQLDEQIALRVQREEDNSEFLKKFSDLERERSQLQDTISSVTEELNRASAALEESEKEAASYKEQFVQKAEIAEEVLSLRDRVKTLEGQLATAVEKKASISSSLGPPSSPDDAYVSLSSLRAVASPLNETGDTSLKNVSSAMSVSSCDISMLDEHNTSKMELYQAKESYMKYHKMSVDLKRDNERLKKELNKLKTQSQLVGGFIIVPLFVIIVSVVAALYPTLSIFTGTGE